jgi:hypothetical protein
MARIELRGDKVTDAPDSPGLYAWYYRPISPTTESVKRTLAQLLSTRPIISTKITQRYGVRYFGESFGEVVLGADERNVIDAINDAFEQAPLYLASLFESELFAYFCRPIYIGISKGLRERIYSQHFVSLIDYWDDGSRVGRFLSAHEDATVQLVMERLDLPHSFALEARVMGIAPRDLMVSIFPTDQLPPSIGDDGESGKEPAARRALERLFQLLADPVCGIR